MEEKPYELFFLMVSKVLEIYIISNYSAVSKIFKASLTHMLISHIFF
jgi:hypothetical protein